jgi:hypothetical protein
MLFRLAMSTLLYGVNVAMPITTIPPALASLATERTWIAWKWWPVTKTGKDGEEVISWTKCPCDVGGRVIKSNDPSHMRDAEFFLSELRRMVASGVQNGPFAGIALACIGNVRGDRLVLDLDKCVNIETGVIADWARGIVEACNSYAEISPSGTGIRIIGDSAGWRVDEPQRYNFWTGPDRAAAGFKETGEAFFQTGFVTVTFNPLAGFESRWSPIGIVASCMEKRPGRTGKTDGDSGERVSSDPLAPPEVVRETLMLIPNDGTVPNNWEQWNQIGMTVFRATEGSDEGLGIWAEWSMQHPSYGAGDNCQDRWYHWTMSSPPLLLGYGSLHREVQQMYLRAGYDWKGGDLWWNWNEARKRQKLAGTGPDADYGLLDIEVIPPGDSPLRSDADGPNGSHPGATSQPVATGPITQATFGASAASSPDQVDVSTASGVVSTVVAHTSTALATLPWLNPALQGANDDEASDASDGSGGIAAASASAVQTTPPGSAVPQSNPGGAGAVVPIPARNTALRAPANLATTMDRFATDPLLTGIVGYDLMRREMTMMRPVPGTRPNSEFPRPLQDIDVIGLLDYLQRIGLQKMALTTVWNAVETVAHINEYHPVRDYLNGLVWDGVRRVGDGDAAGGWLSRYLKVPVSEYARRTGEMFLIQMVKRVMEPGCRADYVLVLQSTQGRKKSSICEMLGAKWYSNNLPQNIGSKDASQHLSGVWTVEVPEFSSFSKADNELLKDFITRRIENYRPAYGRQKVTEPRQCVFIATTNEPTPFKDHTGNRRFWPHFVDDGTIDLMGMQRDRDMLFAEAVLMYRAGRQAWPDETFEREVIKPQQDIRFEVDILEDKIAAWLRQLQQAVTIMDVIRGMSAGSFDWVKIGTREQRRISAILQHLGWEQKRSGPNGERYYSPIDVTKWEISPGSFNLKPWTKKPEIDTTNIAPFPKKGIMD